MPSSKAELLYSVHDEILEILCASTQEPHQGIAQAARASKKCGHISASTCNKLVNVDYSYNLLRHFTTVHAQKFVQELQHEISKVGVVSSLSQPDSHSAEDSEIVAPSAPVTLKLEDSLFEVPRMSAPVVRLENASTDHLTSYADLRGEWTPFDGDSSTSKFQPRELAARLGDAAHFDIYDDIDLYHRHVQTDDDMGTLEAKIAFLDDKLMHSAPDTAASKEVGSQTDMVTADDMRPSGGAVTHNFEGQAVAHEIDKEVFHAQHSAAHEAAWRQRVQAHQDKYPGGILPTELRSFEAYVADKERWLAFAGRMPPRCLNCGK